MRLGEPDPGQALCAEAARALPDDPRVADCFALARAARPRLALGAHVLGLAGTRFGAGDLVATSLSAAIRWPRSTLWVGASLSRFITPDASYDQIAPVAGASTGGDTWSIAAAFAWVEASDRALGTPVAFVRASLGTPVLQVFVSTALSSYRQTPGVVVQAAAGLALTWPDVLTVTLHPELTWVDAATLLSAHASFTFTPSTRTWIIVAGFFGERRYAVDDGGLSIWTGDETHRAGARLGGGLRLGDAFTLTLEARWLALERLRGDPSLIDHRVGALAGLIITL